MGKETYSRSESSVAVGADERAVSVSDVKSLLFLCDLFLFASSALLPSNRFAPWVVKLRQAGLFFAFTSQDEGSMPNSLRLSFKESLNLFFCLPTDLFPSLS